jgi:hypothetical protein
MNNSSFIAITTGHSEVAPSALCKNGGEYYLRYRAGNVEGSVPLVAFADSATVRRRACAGYLGDSFDFAQDDGWIIRGLIP